jgi:hypothetical protein
MEAWQMYMEEFRSRAGDAQSQTFARRELLAEAAHDAYQRASDRLTRDHGWDDEHTLVVMRGLNAAVQRWIELGAADWEALGAELRRREHGTAG